MTDSNGKFRHGPVEPDSYTVSMSKEDYTFTRLDDAQNVFKA